ncbi:MAG: FtsX-like permease family protein [Tannerella sp.]|jgi:lipoprotein-releasing system permease protein|nr:FtsX-like permease family protein [Tannerella sp.]
MRHLNNIKLISSIAFIQLRAKKTQTIVATAGVAFGITVFIFLLSCVKGVNEYISELSLEQCPDIRLFREVRMTGGTVLDKVYADDHNIVHHPKPENVPLNLKDGMRTIEELRRNPLIKAVSGSVKSPVFYHFGSSKIGGEITGIHYEDENSLLNLDAKFTGGSSKELSILPGSVIMGKGLAERLNLKPGDKIPVTDDNGHRFIFNLSGIVRTGVPEKDKTICYAGMETVQNILNVPSSYITDINIKLYDRTFAPEMAAELGKRYACENSDCLKDNPFLFEGEKLQNTVFRCIAAGILLVAGFGIFNILNMMIYEKMKDISIIKAMGFTDSDVCLIFMIQSLAIGIVGAVAGLVSGYFLSWLMTFVPFESDVFVSMKNLPMCFDAIYYILGLCFGLLTTALAGYLPSRKAARLDPITILRG